MMKQKGKIVQWNDDRGFGFIALGHEHFVEGIPSL